MLGRGNGMTTCRVAEHKGISVKSSTATMPTTYSPHFTSPRMRGVCEKSRANDCNEALLVSHPQTSMAAEVVQIPYEIPKFIGFLSSLLQRVAEFNDDPRRPFQPQRISVFHGLTRPAISIRSYLERIFRYANCSHSCYVVAYVYLDRFAQRRPQLPIDSFSVHRLLITSVMVAAKFMDDICYNNEYYAKVGGVSTMEMNFLEMGFLFGVDFRLNVTPSTFLSYSTDIQRQMLLLEPPLLPPPPLATAMAQRFFTEDDSAPHQQQLAAV